jgi:hypothetical protein
VGEGEFHAGQISNRKQNFRYKVAVLSLLIRLKIAIEGKIKLSNIPIKGDCWNHFYGHIIVFYFSCKVFGASFS